MIPDLRFFLLRGIGRVSAAFTFEMRSSTRQFVFDRRVRSLRSTPQTSNRGLSADLFDLEGHALVLAGEHNGPSAETSDSYGPAGPGVHLEVPHADADQDELDCVVAAGCHRSAAPAGMAKAENLKVTDASRSSMRTESRW